MNGLFCRFIEKSCLSDSLVLLCFNHRLPTCGYENMSFQAKLANRFEKSDFHNRMVIDLRKTTSKKNNCL